MLCLSRFLRLLGELPPELRVCTAQLFLVVAVPLFKVTDLLQDSRVQIACHVLSGLRLRARANVLSCQDQVLLELDDLLLECLLVLFEQSLLLLPLLCEPSLQD